MPPDVSAYVCYGFGFDMVKIVVFDCVIAYTGAIANFVSGTGLPSRNNSTARSAT